MEKIPTDLTMPAASQGLDHPSPSRPSRVLPDIKTVCGAAKRF
jgi:hypothetical protein